MMGIAQIDGEDLNSEQMIALLQDAEQRLRAKQSNAFQRRNDAPKGDKPVRLKAHNLPKPYVSTKSGVAKLDRSRVRSEEDHKLASSIKKVEDPVLAKEKKLKVRYIPIRPNDFLLPMRKLNPKFHLEVEIPGPLWVCSATVRVPLHSYSELYHPAISHNFNAT